MRMCDACGKRMFPSLIGRLTTDAKADFFLSIHWFPSLIGRLTTNVRAIEQADDAVFPSLIGRLTTDSL